MLCLKITYEYQCVVEETKLVRFSRSALSELWLPIIANMVSLDDPKASDIRMEMKARPFRDPF